MIAGGHRAAGLAAIRQPLEAHFLVCRESVEQADIDVLQALGRIAIEAVAGRPVGRMAAVVVVVRVVVVIVMIIVAVAVAVIVARVGRLRGGHLPIAMVLVVPVFVVVVPVRRSGIASRGWADLDITDAAPRCRTRGEQGPGVRQALAGVGPGLALVRVLGRVLETDQVVAGTAQVDEQRGAVGDHFQMGHPVLVRLAAGGAERCGGKGEGRDGGEGGASSVGEIHRWSSGRIGVLHYNKTGWVRRMRESRGRRLWDQAGIATALACGLHCIGLAWVLTTMPAVWFSQRLWGIPLAWFGTFERVLLAASLAFALLGLGLGLMRHRHPGPLLLGIVGLCLLATVLVIDWHAMRWVGPGLVMAGGLLLACAHGWNLLLGGRATRTA